MRRAALCSFVVVLLASCGGDGGSSEGTTTTSSAAPSPPTSTTTTIAEVVPEPTDPTASEPVATVEEAGTTTTTLVPVGSTILAVDGRDGCLVGEWSMPTANIDLMASTAVPLSNIRVPAGTYVQRFEEDGTFAVEVAMLATFSFTDTTAEADVFWNYSGTWSTSDGELLLEIVAQDWGVTEVRQGGISMPGADLNLLPPIEPFAGGPYQCADDRLDITATNGSIEVPLLFDRIA